MRDKFKLYFPQGKIRFDEDDMASLKAEMEYRCNEAMKDSTINRAYVEIVVVTTDYPI